MATTHQQLSIGYDQGKPRRRRPSRFLPGTCEQRCAACCDGRNPSEVPAELSRTCNSQTLTRHTHKSQRCIMSHSARFCAARFTQDLG